MFKVLNFYAPVTEESGGGGGDINLPPVRPFVRSFVRLFFLPFVCPDIDTWFVRLSPPTVLELQL